MIPSFLRLSRCAQLNTRRLWNADGTVHAAFHALSTLLLRRSIAVACMQETHAPDSAGILYDQAYRYDGPSSVGGSEAGFLFHESVTAATIPGLPDAQRIRWRLSVGFFAFVLTMLFMVEWMPISALVFGRNWLRLSATHSGHSLVSQFSLAATLMFGGLHSTWAVRGTVIAPCFHIFTSFSKVVVFVFGTTSRGPHTVLERLSIWSSLLWHSGQEVSLCIKVTSAAPPSLQPCTWF